MDFLARACGALLLGAAAAPFSAFAQTDVQGPFTVSGGIDVVSDYRFRGISRSNGKVAVQPSLIVDHDSGVYAGLLGSTLPDSARLGRFELGLVGGFETEIASGTRAGAKLTWYSYPGGRGGAGASDYVDIAGSLSHDIGPLSARALIAYAPKQAALGKDDNLYWNLGLSSGIPNTPVTLSAGLGYTDGALTADGDSFDWSLGAAYVAGAMTFKAEYIDTDRKKTGVKALDKLANPALVFTLGVAF